jgi:hypothetical protein
MAANYGRMVVTGRARPRYTHARSIKAPLRSTHNLRDVGVAGSNPVTPTIDFWSVPVRSLTFYTQLSK